MPTKKQYNRIREVENEFPQTRREDDPAYVSPNTSKTPLMDKDIREPEVWKSIEGFEGLYEISSYGNVKSLSRPTKVGFGAFGMTKERVYRKFTLNGPGKGYPAFSFYKDGIPHLKKIHRLVAYHFCERPDNWQELQVNHEDGDKTNNYYKNLKYGTCEYNINHAFETGLNKKVEKNNKHTSMPVDQFDMSGNFLQTFPSMNEAYRKTGIPTSNIWSAIKNKSYAKGFKWGYAEKNI